MEEESFLCMLQLRRADLAILSRDMAEKRDGKEVRGEQFQGVPSHRDVRRVDPKYLGWDTYAWRDVKGEMLCSAESSKQVTRRKREKIR